MIRGRRSLLALAPFVVLAACQQADVGQPCKIQLGTANAPSASQLWSGGGTVPVCNERDRPCGGEYVEFNNTACENLVCVLSPAQAGSKYASEEPGAGYCSKPCVSNRDCYESDTKLVCRNIILDTTFLASLDPATKERYLGDIEFSNYCGVSLPR